MLAADISDDMEKLRFPCYATPKLDGVRALIFSGIGVMSRSMKKIPNHYVQRMFYDPDLHGLDGELIVGPPTATDVYRVTNSAVSSRDGEPDVKLYVFDRFDLAGQGYNYRREAVDVAVDSTFTPGVVKVPSKYCYAMEDLEEAEAQYLSEGYEGVILRAPEALYKNGRSTIKEQGMCKVKRFKDSEATILSMEEELANRNEAKTNELGHSARSAHKENLVGKGRMGALVVRDIHTGVDFKIGTGFSAEERRLFWGDDRRIGAIAKYRYFPIGVKDRPRHPTYVGMREGWDL